MRVLIADGQSAVRHAVGQALAAQRMDVHAATDGKSALQLIRKYRYDVLLLDVLIAGVSGLDLIPAALTSNPEARVMMISAANDPRTRVRCFELGAVDYVTKPFLLAELVARVRVHSRADGPAPAAVDRRRRDRRAEGRRARDRDLQPSAASAGANPRYLQTSNATLDLVARSVTADGATIPLSARESLVLTYLMRNEGEVCSRGDILHKVWGLNATSGNVVDVYVGRLRAKLPGVSITTVRNAGYVFRSGRATDIPASSVGR